MTKREKKAQLAKDVKELEQAKKALAEFNTRYEGMISTLDHLRAAVTAAHERVKHSAKSLAPDASGEQVVYDGGTLSVTTVSVRPREVKAERLMTLAPDSLKWKGLYKVNMAAFDAARAAGIVPPEANGLIEEGEPRITVAIKEGV